MAPLSITADDSLADAVRKTQGLDFGATDCALPMLDALGKKISVDVFVILTDSETWTGPIHPTEVLRQYRQATGINAKLVVVAMVSNGFTIADPEDAGMLDVVGFDSAAPALIADFAKTLDTETLAGIEPLAVPQRPRYRSREPQIGTYSVDAEGRRGILAAFGGSVRLG